jgi:hypothetical protein
MQAADWHLGGTVDSCRIEKLKCLIDGTDIIMDADVPQGEIASADKLPACAFGDTITGTSKISQLFGYSLSHRLSKFRISHHPVYWDGFVFPVAFIGLFSVKLLAATHRQLNKSSSCK